MTTMNSANHAVQASDFIDTDGLSVFLVALTQLIDSFRMPFAKHHEVTFEFPDFFRKISNQRLNLFSVVQAQTPLVRKLPQVPNDRDRVERLLSCVQGFPQTY